jgi:chromosome segregation ATPase
MRYECGAMQNVTLELILSEMTQMRVSLEGRIDKLDGRINGLEGRIDKLEVRLDARIDQLDGKLNRYQTRMDEQFSEVHKTLGQIQKDVSITRQQTAHLTERVTALEAHQAQIPGA